MFTSALDVHQGRIRNGRSRPAFGLSSECHARWIPGELGGNPELSGLAPDRKNCRKDERHDSAKADNLKQQYCKTDFAITQLPKITARF